MNVSITTQKWLNIILAVAVFEYLHLLYIDVKLFDHVFNDLGYPYRTVQLLSYIDLLYLPFVLYMFYKRMRWGWITFFAGRLCTIGFSLLFYFKEYWPVESAHGLFPYFLLTIFIDMLILIFLWRGEISYIFKINGRTKWLTVLSVSLMLVLLTFVGQYNHTNYAKVTDAENQTKPVGKTADTTTESAPTLLGVIKAAKEKPLDTTYMATGFYFLAEKGKGTRMHVEKSDEVYTISPVSFASVKNISKIKFEKDRLQGIAYTNLYMTFDDIGTKDLATGTGDPRQSKIAVIIANRLLYVVENKTPIKTGIMCIALVDYSEKEMEGMRNSIIMKR